MKAFVVAAGLGTRLRPLTDSRPKALVEIGGEALLGHVLRKLVAAGYDDITVNAYHFADQVLDYVAAHDFGVAVHVSDERGILDPAGPLETGGGILQARRFLEGDSFLVHNVDILSNLDLAALRAAYRPEALGTLVVSDRKTQRYFLFNEQMRLVGWTNLATGEVRSPFADIDPAVCRKYAFAGIYHLSPKVFSVMEGLGFSKRFPVVDFFLAACKEQAIYGYVPDGLEMVDVGKLDILTLAEDFVQRANTRLTK